MARITYMSKTDLLARVRQDRAAFAVLWDGLSEAQMTQRPGPQDDWSVKDLIAHIVWWENLMVGNLIAVKEGHDSQMIYDIDAQNAIVFEENKDRTLADVLAQFETNLEVVIRHIDALTVEQINTVQLPKYPLLDHIIGDTFGHYKLHRADLERYVQQVKST